MSRTGAAEEHRHTKHSLRDGHRRQGYPGTAPNQGATRLREKVWATPGMWLLDHLPALAGGYQLA